MKDIHDIASRARTAFYSLSVSSAQDRNNALVALARLLESKKETVFSANRTDLENAASDNLPAPLLHRLKFGNEKLNQVISGLNALVSLPDPLNKTIISTEIAESLKLYRVSSPIGVVGVIFESRPDALIQISSLCIKSGNAAILKGGREAIHTNQALCEIVCEALNEVHLPADSVQLLESREDVAQMLKEDMYIDLIIPRGSNAFVRYIMDNSRIPVLGHSDGICHVYIDRKADIQKAVKIVLDSKTQNVSVCNAAETLLVHRDIAPLFLPEAVRQLESRGVQVRGDSETRNIVPCVPASDSDWSCEYLDYIISVRTVSSLQDAVDHINHFGSHHTDCIVTQDSIAASEFLNRVDSAGVYWNVSTRFADGFVYGLGAEVGISTGKLHARGPMGLEGLTTYKYKLIGNGQTMSEVKAGSIQYTHKPLHEECPL